MSIAKLKDLKKVSYFVIIACMTKAKDIENPVLQESYEELCSLISKIQDEETLKEVFSCLFTGNERKALTERWQIVKELTAGTTQREIAKKYNMSLCKITRGSKELQKPDCGFKKLLALR